jgi:flagellar motor switch protein FliN/FliY
MNATATPTRARDAPAYEAFERTAPAAGAAPLKALYDLALPVSIELGRTRMMVREILSLGRGSVVELDRLAGEPVDVYVGDRHFAKGEVVVVGEQFGVRITRILAPPVAGGSEEEA